MIAVYACKLPEGQQELIFHREIDYLPEVKKAQIQRFRHREDAYRTLVSYLLLRKVLMKKWPNINLTNLQFTKYGKPYFDSDNLPPFSMSHSGDWCVCVIGADESIGVDIERLTEPQVDLYPLLYSEGEACQGTRDFFNRWTIKESYLKAIGTGLLVDPQEILLKEKQQSEYIVRHQDYSEGKVKVYNLLKEYSLSLCTLSMEEKFPQHLQLFTFIELTEPSLLLN